MKIFFEKVTCSKPSSSRESSTEAFIVCQGFRLPDGFEPIMIDPNINYATVETLTPAQKAIVPFIACGDLSGFETFDKTFQLSL
jgi:tRNA (cytidine32/guanosine34-2'-O)-methyltransferase